MKTKKQQYYMYGIHAVCAALDNPHRDVIAVYCTQDIFNKYTNLISKHKYQILHNTKLSSLIKTDVAHQGIIALVNTIVNDNIYDIDLGAQNIKIAILDQVTDVHNIGSIIRSASAFGIKAIIMTQDHAPDENGVMAKTACGGLEVVSIIKVVNLRSTIDILKKHGLWIIGLDASAKTYISSEILQGKIALVLGSEDKGMRRLTLESCDIVAKIPIHNKMESLNVSNAATIAFYETSKSIP